MYRSLVVPVDGSPFAEQALPLAVSIAKRAGAEMQLVYVHDNREPEYPEHHLLTEESWVTELKTRHRAYLEELTERLRSAGANIKSPAVLQGHVSGTIRKHVVERQVDLVVMTTHGRGPVARMWLGSVADRLIRELPKPLLLVRPVEGKADLTADVSLKHVLVPLDGTPLAEQIIEPAAALGELLGADFTLLRVIQPLARVHYGVEVSIAESFPEAISQQLQRVEREQRVKAQEYLDEIAQRLRGQLLRVRTQVIDDGQPAAAVMEVAGKLGADLIAMQTHGRRGLSRLILGSVADKVLRGAGIPILIQKPHT